MNLNDTVMGQVIATLIHISATPPRQRTKDERYWQLMAETAFTRLYRKIPAHCRALHAQVHVTIGRLVPSGDAAAPADAVSGDAAPPEEKTDG